MCGCVLACRSYKKSNNVQGGQSRVSVRPANISSEPPAGAPPAQHNLQNGVHVQPQPQSQGNDLVRGINFAAFLRCVLCLGRLSSSVIAR